MKPIPYLVVALLFVLVSCSKDDNEPECEKEKYAVLTISNDSDDPYEVTLDGRYLGVIDGRKIEDVNIDEGNNRKLKATQLSGYVLFPTTRETTLNVVRCSDYTWHIP